MEKEILTGLQIRLLTGVDLDAIVEIDRKILGKDRRDYWEKVIDLSDARYPQSCLVAEYEGKVIGFIVGEVSGRGVGVSDTVGWLSTIGVDPTYQHKGIANRLGQEFIRNLKAIGVDVVYTLVNWDDWDLLKFFRAMGFSRGGNMINLEFEIE